jgi:predicted SnoaL-like aldol condensation-catalyzing enzyme
MPEQKHLMRGPMPREHMTANQRAYMDYQNALLADDRAAALRKALTPGFIAHDLPEGHNDLAGIIAFRERVHKMLPDQEGTVRVMLEVGEQIAGYVTATQTDPTTGQPFSIGLIDMSRVEDGKVAERWVAFDDPEGKLEEVKRKLTQRQA